MRKSSALIILIALTVTGRLNIALAEQTASPACTGTQNGLMLRKSNVRDIQSVLGPAMVFKVDLTSEINRMCYVSSLDYRMIAFVISNRGIIQIQVMADKHQYNRWDWCTATALSAEDLTLANGIALGLNPSELQSILGPPHCKERYKWRYVYDLGKAQGRPPIEPRHERNDQIITLDIEFADSGLVRYGVKVVQEGMQPESCP